MKVCFTDEEYALLCALADNGNTTPAQLVYRWTLDRIGQEYALMRRAQTRPPTRHAVTTSRAE